jgi:hypothetical protein
MSQIGRRFVLSDESGTGIFCGKDGVFAGGVPLLERTCCTGPGGHDQWQPRPVSQINRDLSKCFGLPIEFDQKMGGLQAIARALSRGDIIHAQMAALHLEIPDPPALATSAQRPGEITDLAHQLRASGLLKADWDPAKHPRWPAGSPDGIGGEFAPAGAASDGMETGNLAHRSYQRRLRFRRRSTFRVGFHFPPKSCRRRPFLMSIRANSEIPIPTERDATRSGLTL